MVCNAAEGSICGESCKTQRGAIRARCKQWKSEIGPSVGHSTFGSICLYAELTMRLCLGEAGCSGGRRVL